jgi:hypothetical protein
VFNKDECFGKSNPSKCYDCKVRASCRREYYIYLKIQEKKERNRYKQCKGICASGGRCYRKANSASGKCYIHKEKTMEKIRQIRAEIDRRRKVMRCIGLCVNDGHRCTLSVFDNSQLCMYHKNQSDADRKEIMETIVKLGQTRKKLHPELYKNDGMPDVRTR